ncbi:MAG: hypothetical protein LUC24_04605 [Bacteroidales bacterium]|nr:hypothetical protein [Bacteroidales bacterium]
MRKEILDELKAKFTGVSETVLGRIADRLANTAHTPEEVKTAVDGITFQQVLESYGDARATEAQKSAVQNYETRYGLKDGVKVKVDGDTPKQDPKRAEGGEAVPEWAKALIEQNRKLGERFDAMDRDRTTATRRQQLDKVVSKLPESLRKGYSRTAVDTLKDEEFSKLLEEITGEVDGIVKETSAKRAVFGVPGAKTGATVDTSREATKEETDAVLSRL